VRPSPPPMMGEILRACHRPYSAPPMRAFRRRGRPGQPAWTSRGGATHPLTHWHSELSLDWLNVNAIHPPRDGFDDDGSTNASSVG
jgi:hypothetical protein